MKPLLLPCLLLWAVGASSCHDGGGSKHVSETLRQLDRTVAERDTYIQLRNRNIEELKKRRQELVPGDDYYRLNEEIIDGYTSFRSDSAVRYIRENIRLAQQGNDPGKLLDSKLRLAFSYSLSGLFIQAQRIFDEIDPARLNPGQMPAYCWNRIRYFEQLNRYTNDPQLSVGYEAEIRRLRDTLMRFLPEGSSLYAKERAFQLQSQGRISEALNIMTALFEEEQPDTHGYAMHAMGIATLHRLAGNRSMENRYLEIAATADIKNAIMENEALLQLAVNLFEEGDIRRAYNYTRSALDDSNYYNSRFKSALIARVQPIIESNYLQKIRHQQRNLQRFIFALSLGLVVLIVLFAIVWKQKNTIARSRANICEINSRLNEAQFIKEQYIGHFISRCSYYIDKLHAFRKEVNHKIKNGQADQLYKPSAREMERDVEELMKSFDEAFLNLYPRFVEQFNSLLNEEARYRLDDKRLNTELRIFALMRLGITNVGQIAEFLHCSLQTVYNYKSKVKSKTRPNIGNLEEEIDRIRLSSFRATTETSN